MIKNFTVFLILALNLILGQENTQLFKADFPEFIKEKSTFDISVIARAADIDADELNIYIFSDNYFRLNNVLLRTGFLEKTMNVSKADYYNPYGNAYKVSMSLEDSLFTVGTLFQLIIKGKNLRASEVPIGFALVYTKDSKIVARYSSFDESDLDGYIEHIKPEFYKSGKLAGKAYYFENGKMDIDYKSEKPVENLLVEFWLKPMGSGDNIYNLFNPFTNDTLVSLGINKFQILTASGSLKPEIENNTFISFPNWYHFIVNVNYKENKLLIYTNNRLSFSSEISGFNDLKEIYNSLVFDHPATVDNFRIWEYGNSINFELNNYKYVGSHSDSSKIIYRNGFEDAVDLSKKNENYDEEFFNYTIVDSDAPVFSKAPEFNVELHSDFYLLTWDNPEEQNVTEYIVEKSEDGRSFNTVYSVIADDNPEKKYTYAVTKEISGSLVYYRIKQINEDGEILYSSNIKIGQGEKEYFKLHQNFPNPFNPETNISLEILEPVEVEVNVYDLVGKQILTLHKSSLAAGTYNFMFDGSKLPSGLYFYEVKTPYSSQVRKMILAK